MHVVISKKRKVVVVYWANSNRFSVSRHITVGCVSRWLSSSCLFIIEKLSLNNEHRKCFNPPHQPLKIRTNDSGIPPPTPPLLLPPIVTQLLQASKLPALNLRVLPPQENEVTLEVSSNGEWKTFKDILCMSFHLQAAFLPHCWFCTSSSA